MKKEIIKIMPLIFALLFSACPGGKDDSSTSIFSFDQTEEAYNKVAEANEQLKEIKKLFKDNEGRQEDLKTALSNKEAAKVKEISDELVYQINNGTRLGEEAIAKIEKVQEMNVNGDFKTYLTLKAQSLRKYVEAYEKRRQLAILLRDSYDPKDAKQRDRVVEEFKKSDEIFKQIITEAQESSDKANAFAKEILSKRQGS
jgi:hypothetical protein